jgi:hypothetical protein
VLLPPARPDAGARRIVDFAHAAEHVAQIGQAAAPDDPHWLAPRLHRLKHAGPEPVLAELHQQVEQCAAIGPPPPEVTEALTYLDQRVALMQDPTFAAAGWPSGSGRVESANTLVVEARCNGAGMREARPNVNPLLVLRNAAYNDRWDEDWDHDAAHLRTLPPALSAPGGPAVTYATHAARSPTPVHPPSLAALSPGLALRKTLTRTRGASGT